MSLPLRSSYRCPYLAVWLFVALAMLVLSACGGGGNAGAERKAGEASAPAITPSTEPASPVSHEPILTGDAATNASCELATVAEIEQQVDAGVVEMRGLTSPGAYGKNGLSCTWYLDSRDIGIPSVTVQWEFPVTTFHDSVVDLYRSQVDQKLSTRVEGIGDYAVLQGATAETVAGRDIVRATVLMHAEPTPADIDNAIALLRLMLSRAKAS